MKTFTAIFIGALCAAAAMPGKMEIIRTSRGYIVTMSGGTIKCDEVPHNGDNVKYFTREDLLKMLALFPIQPAVP